MPQSLSSVLLHIVFSTKHRESWLELDIEEELKKYIGGICRDLGCPALKIGCADDHIHIACSLSRTMTIAKLLEEIKTGSSKWIKTQDPHFAKFVWQSGYGAFSIGRSQLIDLKQYIANQREHHRRVSFQGEFRLLLSKYEIEFDERFVWD